MEGDVFTGDRDKDGDIFRSHDSANTPSEQRSQNWDTGIQIPEPLTTVLWGLLCWDPHLTPYLYPLRRFLGSQMPVAEGE